MRKSLLLVLALAGCSGQMSLLKRLDVMRTGAVLSCKAPGQCPDSVHCVNAVVAATGTLDGLADAVKAAESGPCKAFVPASKP
jgi:hypothetical protein